MLFLLSHRKTCGHPKPIGNDSLDLVIYSAELVGITSLVAESASRHQADLVIVFPFSLSASSDHSLTVLNHPYGCCYS